MRVKRIGNGHLYGVYDSRGGACFYLGPKHKTDELWLNDTLWDPNDNYNKKRPNAREEFLEETYFGPRDLYIPEDWPTPESGDDLLYRDKIWMSWEAGNNMLIIGPDNNDRVQYFTVNNYPMPAIRCDWGEDACGIIFHDGNE